MPSFGPRGEVFDRPIPGSWIVPTGAPNTVALGTPANGPHGCWLYVPYDTPVDRIGFEVTTAGTAGDIARLALYKKRPGAPILDNVLAETADIAISSTGQKEITIAQTLAAGRYAAFVRTTVMTGAPVVRSRTTPQSAGFYPAEVTELLSDPRGGITQVQIGSPGNATFAPTYTLALGTRAYAPLIYLRAA